nr:MAG TPA: hypothetical protein [Caudoviricetes sp.]
MPLSLHRPRIFVKINKNPPSFFYHGFREIPLTSVRE